MDTGLGLDLSSVEARRSVHGENRITEQPRRPAWLRFLDQFRSLLILILAGAAVLAGLVGDLKDTIVIGIVLVINAVIGFVQENRAERSLDALRTMLVPTARVRRGGVVAVVDAAELVPGDLVLLEAGDRVPADGRLVVAESVEVDESALTGESVPVSKHRDPVSPGGEVASDEVPLAERRSMLFMNTTLTRGRADMVVTATGMATEVGAIAEMLQDSDELATPLQIQIDSVGKRIALIGGVAVSLYAVLALLRGESPSELALSAVALAVATVPEGLPAVLALTLALGVAGMARRGAIVKRLASVETLGSATVICSDKTGTLTLNQMTARALWFHRRRVRVEGEGYQTDGGLYDQDTGRPAEGVDGFLVPLVLCSDATLARGAGGRGEEGVIGDPTEGARVVAAAKAGIEVDQVRAERPRIGEIPFDSDRKFMATLHAEGSQVRMYLKGAPDVLLTRSAWVQEADGPRRLDADAINAVQAEVAALAGKGLRVLAAATTLLEEPGGDPDELADRVGGLTLLGLVGIADPPRAEAREAIALARRAGVAVKMITGDHRDTAAAISAELGIRGAVVTGADLDRLSAAELSDRIEDIGVFARVAPEHKVAVVRALTRRGHVVAMTGDGVNDAAALRNAHMGVAMGLTGTEVTKEAGDMILTDDNFATIVRAVREGRSIYDNVVKFVRFQLSTNIGAISSFLGASALGMPAPLNAIQVLWVNIIMDGPPAMALGVDPARPGLMDEPPRSPDARILNRTRLLRMSRAGLIMAAGTLGVLFFASQERPEAVAPTMAFTTFVLFQFFNALNARAENGTVFTRHLFTNKWLWISLLMVVVLQVLAVQVPLLQSLFGTVSLSFTQWLVCGLVASSVLVVEEIIKLLTRLVRVRGGTERPVGSALPRGLRPPDLEVWS